MKPGTVRKSTKARAARPAKRTPARSQPTSRNGVPRLPKKLALAVKRAELAGTYAGLRGLSRSEVTVLYERLLAQLARAKDSDERSRIKEKLASLTFGT